MRSRVSNRFLPSAAMFVALFLSCAAPPAAVPSPSLAEPVPAVPTSTPTAASTPSPAPKLRFEIDPSVASADEAAIRDGVRRAVAFVEARIGGDAVAHVAVYASRPGGTVALPDHPGGCCNYNNKGAVTFDVSDRVWSLPGIYTLDAYHSKAAAHEYFHAWQNALGCSIYNGPKATMPAWLVEGGAEYVALRTLIDGGIVTEAKVRSNALGEAQAKPSVLLPALEIAPPNTPLPYGILYLSIERLVSKAGLTAYRSFCTSVGGGQRWQTAFATSFGLTTDAFYEDFQSWRAGGFN